MLYPVITPVALPGCYFPLIFTTHFLCMCLLCSLTLQLGWSVLVPLQFCCYELANTRLRGVVEFGVMWPSHGYSTTVSEQLFFFFYQSMGGGKNHSSAFHKVCGQLSVYPGLKMHCYLRVCASPRSQSSRQGVLGEGTKIWPEWGDTNWAMENLTWLFKSTLICCTESLSSHKSMAW